MSRVPMTRLIRYSAEPLTKVESVAPGPSKQHRDWKPRGLWFSVGADWARCADHYQGILVAPYDYNLRRDFLWYSIWDCASGCVWDAAASAEIKPMKRKIAKVKGPP